MLLCKRLAVSVLCGRNFAVFRKNVPALNSLCLHKDSTTRVEFSRIRDAERTFCTHPKKVTNVGDEYAENLWGEEEEEEESLLESIPEETSSTDEMFQEIAEGDPGMLKKLKLLEFELAVLREEEAKVPDRLSKQHWRELLSLPSTHKRRKYLSFLRLNELKNINHKQKAQTKFELCQKFKEQQGFHYYGLSGHTMFMRIYEKNANKYLVHRLLQSNLQFVIDCSYQEYMSLINLKACAHQIFYCFSESRLHRYPCQLKLCNFDKNDALGKMLPNYINGVYDNFYGEIHSESYLDLYPKEKLVYLTPHTKIDLHEFNHGDVYIIGGFVDKGTGVKASLAKAKENNLRMARLPLDDYLIWRKGTKSLPLNTVLSIMLDMAYYGDWNKAFKNVPSRFLTEE